MNPILKSQIKSLLTLVNDKISNELINKSKEYLYSLIHIENYKELSQSIIRNGLENIIRKLNDKYETEFDIKLIEVRIISICDNKENEYCIDESIPMVKLPAYDNILQVRWLINKNNNDYNKEINSQYLGLQFKL